MTTSLSTILSAAVVVGFITLALSDLRTGRVVVRHAQAVTAVAVAGLGLVAVIAGAWVSLLSAILGAVLVGGIQYLPYRLQHRRDAEWIGRADVRLAIPFGWTLGFHGLAYAVVGFATALLAGLVATTLWRRRRIPFVPFLALGLIIGLAWAAAIDSSTP